MANAEMNNQNALPIPKTFNCSDNILSNCKQYLSLISIDAYFPFCCVMSNLYSADLSSIEPLYPSQPVMNYSTSIDVAIQYEQQQSLSNLIGHAHS